MPVITDIRYVEVRRLASFLNILRNLLARAHIRNLPRVLLDFAMWCGVLEVSRNPIVLVVVKGATKRIRKPRSLTVEQFQMLSAQLRRPFGVMALLSVCLGLRVSELLALKWRDVGWLKDTINIVSGILKQIVDDVENAAFRTYLTIDREL